MKDRFLSNMMYYNELYKGLDNIDSCIQMPMRALQPVQMKDKNQYDNTVQPRLSGVAFCTASKLP